MVETNASCGRKCGTKVVCNGDASPDKASLTSRRRRHKTVHFGDNLLLQVCTNANLSSHVSYTKVLRTWDASCCQCYTSNVKKNWKNSVKLTFCTISLGYFLVILIKKIKWSSVFKTQWPKLGNSY